MATEKIPQTSLPLQVTLEVDKLWPTARWEDPTAQAHDIFDPLATLDPRSPDYHTYSSFVAAIRSDAPSERIHTPDHFDDMSLLTALGKHGRLSRLWSRQTRAAERLGRDLVETAVSRYRLMDENHALRKELKAERRRRVDAQQATLYDSLTGQLNRDGLHNYVKALIKNKNQASEALGDADHIAAGKADLTNFKQFNDEHGHEAGDGLIKQQYDELSGLIHGSHVLGRPSGDEADAILHNITQVGVEALDDRIQQSQLAKIESGEYAQAYADVRAACEEARLDGGPDKGVVTVSNPMYNEEGEMVVPRMVCVDGAIVVPASSLTIIAWGTARGLPVSMEQYTGMTVHADLAMAAHKATLHAAMGGAYRPPTH